MGSIIAGCTRKGELMKDKLIAMALGWFLATALDGAAIIFIVAVTFMFGILLGHYVHL
jgi:hypothetical protein